jgi:hypothetical protein
MNQDRPIYAPLTWTQEQEQPESVQAEPDTKIFIVEAVSMFRMRYAVRCRSAEHAADTVVMSEANELSQLHLDEVITSTREVSEAEYLKIFDADNDYLMTWDRDQKMNMIHSVDYDKQG